MAEPSISVSISISNEDQLLQPTVNDGVATWNVPVTDIAVTPDPEAGLTLTHSFTPGTRGIPSVSTTETPEAGKFARNADAVVAADLTGLDGSAGGLVFEVGGGGLGAYVGFAASGAFHVRCGNGGGALPNDTAAYLIVPAEEAPRGDGTLVVEMTAGANAVRAWWNGTALGTPVARASGSSDLAGSNEGAYLGEAYATCVGEIETPVVYETASPMRYYYDQKVSL